MNRNILACDIWHKLLLQGYSYEKSAEIYNNISGEFKAQKILDNIMAIQNFLGNRNTLDSDNSQDATIRNKRAIVESSLNNVTTDMNERDAEAYREGIVHETTTRNRRSVEENVASSAMRAGSIINDLFSWVKDSVGGLFNSKALHIELKEKWVVRYDDKDFYRKEECIQSQASLGLLGLCHNEKEIVVWWQETSREVSQLSVYVLGNSNRPIVKNATLGWESSAAAPMSPHYLYLYRANGSTQQLDLRKIKEVSLSEIFPYLPSERQQRLQPERVSGEVLQHFKQQAAQIGFRYLGSTGLLHTPIGDGFQVLGLAPNWGGRDDSHFLARWLTTGQQLLLQTQSVTGQVATVSAALLETALLHPKIQRGYCQLMRSKDFCYGKQAVRLVADLLQFGVYNLAFVPSVLEYCFANYEPIHTITWGLRAALSLVSMTNDLSYYYLGMALFFLPQLPMLLEHMGVPVTRYISQALDKLATLFIFQSLWVSGLGSTVDPERLVQQGKELRAADQRVDRGRQRLARVVTPMVGFFKPTTSRPSDNDPKTSEKARHKV